MFRWILKGIEKNILVASARVVTTSSYLGLSLIYPLPRSTTILDNLVLSTGGSPAQVLAAARAAQALEFIQVFVIEYYWKCVYCLNNRHSACCPACNSDRLLGISCRHCLRALAQGWEVQAVQAASSVAGSCSGWRLHEPSCASRG